MTEKQQQEVEAAADAAWAAYTTAIQAVERAPIDWDAHNIALLWQDAERCAAAVARLIEGAR